MLRHVSTSVRHHQGSHLLPNDDALTSKLVGAYCVFNCVTRYLCNKLDLFLLPVELHIVDMNGTGVKIKKNSVSVCSIQSLKFCLYRLVILN